MGTKKQFISTLIACSILGSPVFANDTMDVLTGGKKLQVTTASGVSFIVTFTADGQYTTNTGSSGTWTLSDDTLCTLKQGSQTQSCGTLPSGKSDGDSWSTTDSSGNAITASII